MSNFFNFCISAGDKSSDANSAKNDTSSSNTSKDKAQSTSTDPSATDSSANNVFTSPGLQGIMHQMVQNPQLIEEMFNAPYMQSMMEALSANPEVASQVIKKCMELGDKGSYFFCVETALI